MRTIILLKELLEKAMYRSACVLLVNFFLIIAATFTVSAQGYPDPTPDFAHPANPHSHLYSPYGGSLDRPLLVIYRQFTNESPDPIPDSAWAAQRFFGPGFPNLQAYYWFNSFGELRIEPAPETQGTVDDGIVVVNTGITADDFWAMSTGDQRKTGLEGADPFVNFAEFDTNPVDGIVTNEELLVVQMHVARNATECCGQSAGTNAVTLDGKQINLSVAQGTEITNLMTHIHEVGHVALWTMDFYGYGVGSLDAYGPTCCVSDNTVFNYNAYNKTHLGWIQPTVVTKDGFYEIHDAQQMREAFILYDYERGTNDYFIIENRQRDLYDQSISDEGLVIWRIDEDEAAFYNSDPNIRMIEIMRPDGTTPPAPIFDQDGNVIWIYGGESYDAWDPSDPATPERTMARNWRDGTPSGVAVRAIGPSGFAMRAYFDVRGPGVLVDPSTAAGTPMEIEVVPGQTSLVAFPVMNTGEVRDGFDYTVVGIPADWYVSTYRQHSDPGVIETAVIDVVAPADAAVGEYAVEALGRSITDPSVYTLSPLTLTVNPPGVLEVTPADGLLSSGPQWGSFSPSTKVYTLRNTGGRTIGWTADNIASWVSRDPYGGTLEPGATATMTVSINTKANQLVPGTHNDTVSFTNYTNGYGNTTRPVRLTVTAVPGSLSVGPSDGFTSSGSQGTIFAPPYKQYSLTNAGGSSFNWTATKTQPWVTLSATSGTLELNQSVLLQVTINDNAKSLAPGVYNDTVSFTNTTDGNGNATRAVSLTVEAVGALTVTPADGMTSAGSEGGPFSPLVKVYTLTNTGSDSINWTATKYYSQQWVSLSASSGTLASGQSATVTVSINAHANTLGEGSYTDAVIFTNTTSHIGNTSRLVNLSIIGGTPGNLYVGPSDGFSSSGNQGGGFSPPYKVYSLTNTGEMPIDWTATTYFGNPWVSLSTPTSGTLENGQNITVRVSINTNANSLLPGSHSELLVFTNTTNGIGNATRTVDLTVNAIPVPGNLYVGPSDGFTSSGNQGGGFSPPYKTYTLVNTGETPIDWTATNNTQPWISFTASTGTLAGSESIGIAVLINSDANSLAPGSHSDSVVFNNTTNGNGTTNRPVSLTVNTFPGHLSVIQTDEFASSGDEGGTFSPPYKVYTLANTGGTTIDWTAAKTQDWVSLSETSGTLANGENIGIAVSINTTAKSLEPGTHSDTVSFTNTTNGNGNATRVVALTVNCVSIGQADIDCDGDVDGQDLTVFAEEVGLGSNSISIEKFAENYGW